MFFKKKKKKKHNPPGFLKKKNTFLPTLPKTEKYSYKYGLLMHL